MIGGKEKVLARLLGASDPGVLFIRAWAELAKLQPADRSAVPDRVGPVARSFEDALSRTAPQDATAALESVIEAQWQAGDTLPVLVENASVLCALMNKIDRIFANVHPRTRILSPKYAVGLDLPLWLQSARDRRLLDGEYARDGHYRLIPNGPFVRHAAGRDSLSGDSLQDRFPHLTVAPLTTRHEDNQIRITIKVVGTGRARGLPPSKSIGKEQIRFIPLAEDAGDLDMCCGTRAGRATLDVRPKIDTATRLIETLAENDPSDISFAPELTVNTSDEERLTDAVANLLDQAPRILLAGSGLTEEKDELDRCWNEARVITKGGAILWRQRKVWPFEMHQNRAVEYGLEDPGEGGTLNEDIAGHDEITIVDLDGFGRAVILICQDFEAQIAIDEIVRRYQPDWVFVPILDAGVNVPGWTPNRASKLNGAQSRFLVGSSLTLSRRRGDKVAPPIGIAVGPASPTGGPPGTAHLARALAVVDGATVGNTISGLLVWDHRAPTWTQLNLGPA